MNKETKHALAKSFIAAIATLMAIGFIALVVWPWLASKSLLVLILIGIFWYGWFKYFTK